MKATLFKEVGYSLSLLFVGGPYFCNVLPGP
jgi:hypothetical protein